MAKPRSVKRVIHGLPFKPKQSLWLKQRDGRNAHDHFYKVTRLRNLTTPHVGEMLDENMVNDLIVRGIEVSIDK